MTWLLVLAGLMVPRCEYVAVTFSGNEYVVGSGDTCVSASDGWVVPEDWYQIERRESVVWRFSR